MISRADSKDSLLDDVIESVDEFSIPSQDYEGEEKELLGKLKKADHSNYLEREALKKKLENANDENKHLREVLSLNGIDPDGSIIAQPLPDPYTNNRVISSSFVNIEPKYEEPEPNDNSSWFTLSSSETGSLINSTNSSYSSKKSSTTNGTFSQSSSRSSSYKSKSPSVTYSSNSYSPSISNYSNSTFSSPSSELQPNLVSVQIQSTPQKIDSLSNLSTGTISGLSYTTTTSSTPSYSTISEVQLKQAESQVNIPSNKSDTTFTFSTKSSLDASDDDDFEEYSFTPKKVEPKMVAAETQKSKSLTDSFSLSNEDSSYILMKSYSSSKKSKPQSKSSRRSKSKSKGKQKVKESESSSESFLDSTTDYSSADDYSYSVAKKDKKKNKRSHKNSLETETEKVIEKADAVLNGKKEKGNSAEEILKRIRLNREAKKSSPKRTKKSHKKSRKESESSSSYSYSSSSESEPSWLQSSSDYDYEEETESDYKSYSEYSEYDSESSSSSSLFSNSYSKHSSKKPSKAKKQKESKKKSSYQYKPISAPCSDINKHVKPSDAKNFEGFAQMKMDEMDKIVSRLAKTVKKGKKDMKILERNIKTIQEMIKTFNMSPKEKDLIFSQIRDTHYDYLKKCSNFGWASACKMIEHSIEEVNDMYNKL